MRNVTDLDVIDDRWRPTFHLCPSQGLINDPNGLIYWRGAYHVFYQWNPTGCTHLNKHWAHAKSTDLIHWELLPIAITPDMPYDAQGCYSGSAVDVGDAMVLMYTGNVRDEAGGRSSYQCLARSSDGVRFDKLGPVIDGAPPGYTDHFRDPKLWRQNDAWHAVIGAQRDDLKGTVVLATSDDLHAWRIVGELLAPTASCYMVECPDLFELDGESVLIGCWQSEATRGGETRRDDVAGYLIGDVDLDTAAFSHGEFRLLDRGFDFYAPQTLLAPDGRRLMIGWMGLPSQPDTPTVASGWTHCLTIPRELSVEGGRLRQRPLRELERLRGAAVTMPETALEEGESMALPQAPGAAWELDVSIDSGTGGDWILHVFESDEQSLRVVHDGCRGRLTLVRHCPAAGHFDDLADCEIAADVTRLRLFVDSSSVEIFVNDGDEVFTTRCYPPSEPASPRVSAEHSLTLYRTTMWSLQNRDA
ncbi:fructosidase [Burkholderia ubonensis]|uniref:Sucrose-6-phosphate hydrolase n=1 Tax=Burkholderia ubonensis TaxID=101571 RepID=A0A102K3U0_9BURK|nr:glycoside hydrolase family 32 protein [Burkholderia ubonensis]KUZ67625.1 fructosidase [Burkholderia ubonensis]KUZ68137.1 fructosidase [Burkholderia ubonensis]KUZ93557.1 fructosidase [Burkholderia ubonensis]KUZ94907.1 fructosidase [Burkholderia ubonensis]KVA02065.1 fructosidase [Burkholderia ubonensis]